MYAISLNLSTESILLISLGVCDFVDYDPFHGASDDQLTEICNDIYDYLLLGTLNA